MRIPMASVDVELKVLCLQSRASEEASERAKQEKLAAAVENYVLAEEKYKKVAELKKVIVSELEARRAEAQALKLAYVQKYGEYISDDET